MVKPTLEFSRAIIMNNKYTFHLLGLAHLPVSEKYGSCAFTQKIVKMAKMLMGMGHTVYLYGAEGSDAPCTEFIQTHTLKDIREAWGNGDNRFEIGYDWQNNEFRHDFNKERTEATKKYFAKAIEEINKRKKPDDFLMITQGVYQREIDKAVGLYLTIEPGIGYRGSYAKFRAFESSYLQNFTYGSEFPKQSINGRFYDRVIPNYYDPKDFPGDQIVTEKSDYYLYVGRQIQRKGIDIAIKTCDILGVKLKIAGQGKYQTKSKNVEFVGYVDSKKRFELMTNAIATFVPTLYLEAFGGVAVESMLCGTPVISTNFGVFPETVINRVTGFRGNVLADFVAGAVLAKDLDAWTVRKNADKFLIHNVQKQFQAWFDDMYANYESTISDKKGWHRVYD